MDSLPISMSSGLTCYIAKRIVRINVLNWAASSWKQPVVQCLIIFWINLKKACLKSGCEVVSDLMISSVDSHSENTTCLRNACRLSPIRLNKVENNISTSGSLALKCAC